MVSIVVPIYNGEKFIESAYAQLVDAANQLKETIEILFVNDGSTDRSAILLDELAKKDGRVRIISKSNGGIASARNTGLDEARGEYICFVDQDDVVKPDMLSVLYTDLERTGADFVQAGASSIRDGIEAGCCDTQEAKTIESGSEAYEQCLQNLVMRGIAHYEEYKMSGSIWCCMFRTDFLKENNISFYRFCDYEDDWIFLTLALVHAKRICLESKTVYGWNIHSASESHNRVTKDRYLEDLYEKHRLLRAFFLEALKSANVPEALYEQYECELQKQSLLWSLSNETGRGICKHSPKEIVQIMSDIVSTEKREGICRRINRRALYISAAGAKGVKRFYYVCRDKLLTFLLLHRQIRLAVFLNQKVFHGRWHI